MKLEIALTFTVWCLCTGTVWANDQYKCEKKRGVRFPSSKQYFEEEIFMTGTNSLDAQRAECQSHCDDFECPAFQFSGKNCYLFNDVPPANDVQNGRASEYCSYKCTTACSEHVCNHHNSVAQSPVEFTLKWPDPGPCCEFRCSASHCCEDIRLSQFRSAQVIENRRCQNLLWNDRTMTSKEAQQRCLTQNECVGLMWHNNGGGDGRTTDSGWYQGCGRDCDGTIADSVNNDWSIIVRPDLAAQGTCSASLCCGSNQALKYSPQCQGKICSSAECCDAVISNTGVKFFGSHYFMSQTSSCGRSTSQIVSSGVECRDYATSVGKSYQATTGSQCCFDVVRSKFKLSGCGSRKSDVCRENTEHLYFLSGVNKRCSETKSNSRRVHNWKECWKYATSAGKSFDKGPVKIGCCFYNPNDDKYHYAGGSQCTGKSSSHNFLCREENFQLAPNNEPCPSGWQPVTKEPDCADASIELGELYSFGSVDWDYSSIYSCCLKGQQQGDGMWLDRDQGCNVQSGIRRVCKRLDCSEKPPSRKTGWAAGCGGAVTPNGIPSGGYCTNTGNAQHAYEWHEQCCDWLFGSECVAKDLQCTDLPPSTNKRNIVGCAGAIWSSGAASWGYCQNRGVNAKGRYGWYAKCCDWRPAGGDDFRGKYYNGCIPKNFDCSDVPEMDRPDQLIRKTDRGCEIPNHHRPHGFAHEHAQALCVNVYHPIDNPTRSWVWWEVCCEVAKGADCFPNRGRCSPDKNSTLVNTTQTEVKPVTADPTRAKRDEVKPGPRVYPTRAKSDEAGNTILSTLLFGLSVVVFFTF